MLVVELWKPPRTGDPNLKSLPVHGSGKYAYILDVYSSERPFQLYRCWVLTDDTEKAARATAKQYPNKWTDLWKEQFLKQKEELFPLDMIYKVTEMDMSAAQKLHLIELICKEQIPDV